MATNTEHYNLVKPDYADAADVGQLNGNMDIIDDLIWQLANAGGDEEILNLLRQIIALIGETADTGGSTTLGSVMAKLNAMLTKIGEGTTGKTIIAMLEELLTQPKVIKHIQSGTANAAKAGVSITLSGFINLEKMIVVLESGASFYGVNNTRGYYVSFCPAYKSELTLTKLSIGFSGASNSMNDNGTITGQVGYQVIELF